MSPAPKPAAQRVSTLLPSSSQRTALSFREKQEIYLCHGCCWTRFSLGASLLTRRQQKRNEIFQILLRERFRVIGRHQGFARLLIRTQLGPLEGMQLLASVQHFDGKTVFVQHHALQLCPVGSYHRRRFILLRKILHRLGEPCRQPLTRAAH